MSCCSFGLICSTQHICTSPFIIFTNFVLITSSCFDGHCCHSCTLDSSCSGKCSNMTLFCWSGSPMVSVSVSCMILWIFYYRAKWTLSHMILLFFYITAEALFYILYESVCRNSDVDTTMSYKYNPSILKNNFARAKSSVLSFFLIE